jgi:hypothetical protein
VQHEGENNLMPIGPYALDDFLDLVKSFHGSVAPFREANAKWLTHPAFDPVTLTAEYKACAVRVDKL